MIAGEDHESLSATARARLTRRKRLEAKESTNVETKIKDDMFPGNIDQHEARDEGSSAFRSQETGRLDDQDMDERKANLSSYTGVNFKPSHKVSGMVSLKDELMKSQGDVQNDPQQHTSFTDSDIESEDLSDLSQDDVGDEDGGLIWDLNTGKIPLPDIPFPEISEKTLEHLDTGTRALIEVFEQSSELALGTFIHDQSCFRVENGIGAIPMLENGIQQDLSQNHQEASCDESRGEVDETRDADPTAEIQEVELVDHEPEQFSERETLVDEKEKIQPEDIIPEHPPQFPIHDIDDLESILDGSPSTSDSTLMVLQDLKSEEDYSGKSLQVPETKVPQGNNVVSRSKDSSKGTPCTNARRRWSKGNKVEMKCIGNNKSARVLCISPNKQAPNRYVPPKMSPEFKNNHVDHTRGKTSWQRYGFGRLKNKAPTNDNSRIFREGGKVDARGPTNRITVLAREKRGHQRVGQGDMQDNGTNSEESKRYAEGLKELYASKKMSNKLAPVKASTQGKNTKKSSQQPTAEDIHSERLSLSTEAVDGIGNMDAKERHSTTEKERFYPVKIDVLFQDIENSNAISGEGELRGTLQEVEADSQGSMGNSQVKHSAFETIGSVSSSESAWSAGGPTFDWISHTQPHFAQLVVGRQSLAHMSTTPVNPIPDGTSQSVKDTKDYIQNGNEEAAEVRTSPMRRGNIRMLV